MTSIPLMRGLFYVMKVGTALLLDMAREPWPNGKVGDGKVTQNDSQPDPGHLRWNAALAGDKATAPVQVEGAIHAAVPSAGASISTARGLAAGR